MLDTVRLFVIMDEFEKYKKVNNISSEQFKKSLKKVICEERHKHQGSDCTSNEITKIDAISKKLVKIFDANKNGKLEY